MENKKQGTLLADILFLIEMTFVVAFPNPSMYKAISIIVFFGYMTFQSIMKKHSLGEFLQYVWALGFFGFCHLSTIWSAYPKAIEDVITNVQWAFMISISVVNYVRIYNFSVTDIAKRMLIIGLIFLVDVALNGEYIEDRFTVVIGGYALNENAFGQIAVGIAAFMIYWGKKSNWKNIIVNAVAVLMIVLGLISGSRKCLISAAIYMVAFTMYEYPPKDIVRSISKILAVALAIAIVYWLVMNIEFLYTSIGSRVESLFAFFGGDDEADGSAFTRANMIESAMEMFRDKPILGYGLNTFSKVAGFDTYSHNNYIELLANLGLVGMLIYYLPIVVYFLKTFFIWRKGTPEIILALCNIGLFLLNDFASVSYFAMPTHLFLALGIGTLVNVSEKRRQEQQIGKK